MKDSQKTNDYVNMFTHIQPVRGFEGVVMQIQEAINTGEIKVGDRLPSERDLSNLFNVSRTTVREAIRVLEAERIVEVRRGVNGGIIIVEPKPDRVGRSLEALIRFKGATFYELAEFRTDFEGQATFLAAQRATEEEVRNILDISKQFSALVEDPKTKWQEIVEVDLSFHEAVVNASHNQIHIAILLGIHSLLRNAALSIEISENISFRKQQAEDLRNISSAICERDAVLAKTIMETHVMRNIETKMNQG
jgi:GntR family transcriptional repressor for pyruvate dehydrogenase complex